MKEHGLTNQAHNTNLSRNYHPKTQHDIVYETKYIDTHKAPHYHNVNELKNVGHHGHHVDNLTRPHVDTYHGKHNDDYRLVQKDVPLTSHVVDHNHHVVGNNSHHLDNVNQSHGQRIERHVNTGNDTNMVYSDGDHTNTTNQKKTGIVGKIKNMLHKKDKNTSDSHLHHKGYNVT